MSDEITPNPAPKRAYQTPKLTEFGTLSKLTQNGTAVTSENNGKPLSVPGIRH